MPRSIAARNGDIIRCSTCGEYSLRLPGGCFLKGCECGGGWLVGEVPDGVLVAVGEEEYGEVMEDIHADRKR